MLSENNVNLRTAFIDILCYILILLGIIGNLLGLFIFLFSRFARRKSTIYIRLAIWNSIANVFCIFRYACMLHSRAKLILQYFIGHLWWACKIYEFSFSFRIMSSWITLFWMFERLIFISMKFQISSSQWKFIKLKFIFPIPILIFILCISVGPSLYMFEPQTIIDQNRIQNVCGINRNASIEWINYFYENHFGRNHHTIRCFFSELIPTFLIISLNTSIIYRLYRNYQHFHGINHCQSCWKHIRITSNMYLVLFLHSCLLLSSFLSHLIGYWIRTDVCQIWWISLVMLINCSSDFYIYCLSDKTFRKEARRFVKQIISYLRKQHEQSCCFSRKKKAIYYL